jgi:hypothetical protein
MPEKLYRQASATRSAIGAATSQPIENEMARLALDQSRIVCRRPQRSAMVPPMIEPAMLAT